MARTLTAPPTAPPCVWMSAGLLSYHLCDHDYDCERCPLDAALRGVRPPAGAAELPAGTVNPAVEFPSDRAYSPGHLWVLRGESPRVGIDAFAAALAGPPVAIDWCTDAGEPVAEGGPLCTLELGGAALPLASPVAGSIRRRNPRLDEDPGLAARQPYAEGWLVELAPGSPLPSLFDPAAADLRARLDLRHLRHRIAAELLADATELGPTLPDGGRMLTDLRGILGLRRYVELLRELVH